MSGKRMDKCEKHFSNYLNNKYKKLLTPFYGDLRCLLGKRGKFK